jgi:hypothetical protein
MLDAARPTQADTPREGDDAMDHASDSSDPATWDPALDAVTAAPRNHAVLYEDDVIRVLAVSVAPGETENPHHHRWPSVMVFDRTAKIRDYNGATGEANILPPREGLPLPLTIKFPSQALHYVQNCDTRPIHATRIEFKKGFPTQM